MNGPTAGSVLDTIEARALAAEYQSPGPVGRTFAAFASGRKVSYEDFIAEIEMTASECGFDSHDDMVALLNYAGTTDDPVWA